MKERFKFNINKINTELFESDVDIDDLIEIEQDEEVILEKCKRYDQLDYSIKIYKGNESSDDYWIAEHPDLPGCITHGKSKEEALKNLEDAKKGWIFARISGGGVVPEPLLSVHDYEDLSGKILLRLPKELHYKITKMAKSNSISINQELIYLLSCAIGEASVSQNISERLNEIKDILSEKI